MKYVHEMNDNELDELHAEFDEADQEYFYEYGPEAAVEFEAALTKAIDVELGNWPEMPEGQFREIMDRIVDKIFQDAL